MLPRTASQVEEENANRIEAQQRVQKEALATAAAEAARAAEVAAATMAAAAAADAAREAMDAAEQDEFKRRAQRLKVPECERIYINGLRGICCCDSGGPNASNIRWKHVQEKHRKHLLGSAEFKA